MARVVGAVAAGLDEHGPAQTEPLLERLEVLDPAVGWRVGPVGSEREAMSRAEDVTVGVARPRGRSEPAGRVRIGMRWRDRAFHGA